MKSAFTGQLYQLHSKSQLPPGAYVAVNGPWDSFGVVMSSKQEPCGKHLNLIRGVRPRSGERTVASF
jgi:hypothetical protein